MAGAGALLVALANGATAQGKRTASFTVTAVQSSPGGQLTMTSQVWATSSSARADIKHPLAGSMRVLVNGPHLFQLDPAGKKGVRGPLPPGLAKSPDKLPAFIEMLALGTPGSFANAKRLRTETVAGYTCDVYTSAKNQGGAKGSLTVWMPQKMEPKFPVKAMIKRNVQKPGVSVNETLTITLSNIKLNAAIPASVFAVPAGYKITEGKPPAPKGPGGGK
ncbi:MAG TPA: hypothetical protein VK689_15615 [Armatimonadota bacterium]|nr:hypothetical protein [Armatimonadota bacterium]